MQKKLSRTIEKLALTGGLAACLNPAAMMGTEPGSAAKPDRQEGKTVSGPGPFYCNSKVLSPAERVEHQKLTAKLLAVRSQVLETEKGYELQFAPAAVSLAELADWTAAESRCCPFLDFHIDLERAGTLLCLRLTGEPGVKRFIETEFHLAQS
jgi:hypothetical protein